MAVADTEQFIVATLALWAGDFEYAEKILSEYSPPFRTPSLTHEIDSPEELIRRTGALRLRQLWRKKAEFKELAREYNSEKLVIGSQPTILETNHLRAALWRTGVREFNLHGYLTKLTWQNEMLRLAHQEALQNERLATSVPPGERSLFKSENESLSGKPLGVAWIVSGNPFLQAQLSDLCMLEVNGIWTAPRLPATAEEINGPFLKVLKSLDPERLSKEQLTVNQSRT